MATLADVRAFADAYRDRLTSGEHYDRALRELLSDAAHFAKLGQADSADAYLGMAIVHAETGQAVIAYGWDNYKARYKARARRWLQDTATPDPERGVGA
jgi:hypothetical protein